MQQAKQVWTVKSLLEWSIKYFESKGIPQPKLSSELLLCSVLDCKRVQLYLNFDYVIKQKELAEFKQHILKRVENIPIQYILNESYFRDISLYVDENVLIPRPETELLVDRTLLSVIDYCKKPAKNCQVNILEIGTGSGAISISIANEIDDFASKKNVSLNWDIVATDISHDALVVAKKNSKKILDLHRQAKVHFIEADIIPKNHEEFNAKYLGKINILVSNPPYIMKDDYRILPGEIRFFEPKLALLAGDTGLEVYKRILDKIFPLLDASLSTLLFETDPKTAAKLKDLLIHKTEENKFSILDLKIINDYNNLERIAVSKIKRNG